MQKKAAALVAANLDLAASDEFVATRANAPRIERRPFAAGVRCAENVQTLFRSEMLWHAFTKRPRARARNRG